MKKNNTSAVFHARFLFIYLFIFTVDYKKAKKKKSLRSMQPVRLEPILFSTCVTKNTYKKNDHKQENPLQVF